jgi:3-hydroxy acid dehydrogenase/malonic semialdehyde reductase
MSNKHTSPDGIAFITGASSGIGLAAAERFASEGKKLVLMARRKERLDALAQRLSQQVPCHVIDCDVRDLDALAQAVATLPEDFRDIDILLNNAGLALGVTPAQTTPWSDWQQMIDTNCTALAFLTHQLLPGMVARKRGHIINIGSVAGTYPYPGGNVYCASKAFVEQFSLALRADLLGTGVRVTNIEPGLVGGSEFSNIRLHGDDAKAAEVYKGAEYLLPSDIADAIAWAANQPAYVNINRIEIMPVCQASDRLAVHRAS